MAGTIIDILISKISPRPPARSLTESFWQWLQEQIEKIRVELAGRHQLFYTQFTVAGNPALAGEQLIHEVVIASDVFTGSLPEKIRLLVFGALANNANNKTIAVKVNGILVAQQSNAVASVASRFSIDMDFFIQSSTLQNARSHLIIETITASTTRIQGVTAANYNIGTGITIGFYATSAASAANDIIMHGFTLESARVQRS